MKGFFLGFLPISILVGVLFVAGWLSFWAPADSYTVFRSKTSGVLDQVAGDGAFIWRLEGLLPTNISLESFDSSPLHKKITLEGVLYRGEDFTGFLGLEKLFEYKVTVVVFYRWNPERLPHLVRSLGLSSAESPAFLAQKAPELERSLRIWLLGPQGDRFDAFQWVDRNPKDLVAVLREYLTGFWRDVTFESLVIRVDKAPDTVLYDQVRATFEATATQLLVEQRRRSLVKNRIALREAEKLELLARYGALLEKYPGLRALFGNGQVPEVRSVLPSLLPLPPPP